MLIDKCPIIKKGMWLYNNQIPCEVRIVQSSILYGSGDYEDPPEIANDLNIECYYILYATTAEPQSFAEGGVSLTIEEAMAKSKNLLGSTLKWID